VTTNQNFTGIEQHHPPGPDRQPRGHRAPGPVVLDGASATRAWRAPARRARSGRCPTPARRRTWGTSRATASTVRLLQHGLVAHQEDAHRARPRSSCGRGVQRLQPPEPRLPAGRGATVAPGDVVRRHHVARACPPATPARRARSSSRQSCSSRKTRGGAERGASVPLGRKAGGRRSWTARGRSTKAPSPDYRA
jgi:hypothetical protein